MLLICDLDDCLIKTDSLYEQWLMLLKKRPLLFFLSFLWFLKGKAHLKSQIAAHTIFHAERLPYRHKVIDYIKDFKKTHESAKIVLASASPNAWVQSVANHLGIFDEAIGSESQNLKGTGKLNAIQTKWPKQPFTYIGDHSADLAIWKEAEQVVAVNPSPYVKNRVSAMNKKTVIIEDKKSPWKFLVKQIRPHQWVKNVLVFLPALAGHKFFNSDTLFTCVAAFTGFSFSASFVYVLNDLLDLPSDRNHHTKKNRPFASGDLSIRWGLVLLPTLLLFVAGISAFLPIGYSQWIAVYFILNIAYSFYLKQSVVVDIIALSMMYTLRVLAGGAASSVAVSEWLLSFSTLFFFSLACIKRYTEIIRSKTKITIDGRGYRQVDHSMVQTLGVGSGLISMLVILLYLQSKEVRALYHHPENLWFIEPILLFWISRIWILANRDEVHDDPVVFAVKDKTSWVCLGFTALVLGFSI